MAHSSKQVKVYLEIGKKRAIAGAIEWPGWCRVDKADEAALQALLEYGPRYERVMRNAHISFDAPTEASDLVVAERVEGNTTTDFGAPEVPPSTDSLPLDHEELRRLQDLMVACWSALDAAAREAEGKELRKGPRGGGRELSGIVRHVLDAESSYLSRLGGKLPPELRESASTLALDERRKAILEAMSAAARGEFPAQGPRGGARWSPRFFVRRAAWHILDHVWEIEDRAE